MLDPRVADDAQLLSQISALVKRTTPLHFYLEAGDLRFATERELDTAARPTGVPFELLYRAADWFRLAGRELRTSGEPELPAELVPWHPEFGKWWHHLLQRYLLERAPGSDAR